MSVTLHVIVPVCVIGPKYYKRKIIEGSPVQEQLLISFKLMKFDQAILSGVIPRIASQKPLLNLQTVSFYKGNAKKRQMKNQLRWKKINIYILYLTARVCNKNIIETVAGCVACAMDRKICSCATSKTSSSLEKKTFVSVFTALTKLGIKMFYEF